MRESAVKSAARRENHIARITPRALRREDTAGWNALRNCNVAGGASRGRWIHDAVELFPHPAYEPFRPGLIETVEREQVERQ
jgi:hypothetical protein